MKKILFIITTTLVLIHLMTAFIGWPGGDSYSLVIKPYPSLLWQIPHMEEHVWTAAVKTGEIPKWVAQEQYIELVRSGDEVEPPLLVSIYMYLRLLTVFMLVVTTVASVASWWKQSIATNRARQVNR